MRFNEYIPAPNSSLGFHYQLFNYLDKYSFSKNTILLVSEKEDVIPVFKKFFPDLDFYNMGYEGEHGEIFTDLNILHKVRWTYDIVFNQAVLEHVCRPSIFVENLANYTTINGHIIIHTHNPKMAEHKWPHDCVRFLKDFWFCMEDYIPAKVTDYEEMNEHVFVVYERV